MPKRKYSLKRGEPRHVKISWSIFSSPYLTVRFSGKVIGSIRTRYDGEMGQNISLEDGSILHLQIVDGDVHVSRNGQPLPGSPTDPFHRLRTIARLIYFIGGFNILLGMLLTIPVILFIPTMDAEIRTWLTGGGVVLILNGLMFIILGYFTRQYSPLALGLTLGLYTFDALVLLIPGNLLTIVLYIVIFMKLFQGFQAIKEIQSTEGTGLE